MKVRISATDGSYWNFEIPDTGPSSGLSGTWDRISSGLPMSVGPHNPNRAATDPVNVIFNPDHIVLVQQIG